LSGRSARPDRWYIDTHTNETILRERTTTASRTEMTIEIGMTAIARKPTIGGVAEDDGTKSAVTTAMTMRRARGGGDRN